MGSQRIDFREEDLVSLLTKILRQVFHSSTLRVFSSCGAVRSTIIEVLRSCSSPFYAKISSRKSESKAGDDGCNASQIGRE